jgi:hypothetical protein
MLVMPTLVSTVASFVLLAGQPVATGVLMLAQDAPSEASSPALEGYAQEALAAFPNTRVVRSQELFQGVADVEAQSAAARADGALRAGEKAFDAHKDRDAERALKSALADYRRAAAALKDCSGLCQATALMAASLERRGDVEGARAALLDLLALEPNKPLQGARYRPSLVKLREAVLQSREASMRGSLVLDTSPEGAQVFVDGAQVGSTPYQNAALTYGRHFVRVERAGYATQGRFVDIHGDEEVRLRLSVTSAYESFKREADKIARDLMANDVSSTTRWAAHAGLARVLVGTVREPESGFTEVQLRWVDTATGRSLGVRKMSFRDSAYGQLRPELQRAVTALVNEAGEKPRARQGADPLDGRQGIERWSGEDRGGRAHEAEQAQQHKDEDPLNRRDGTKGW